MLLLPLILCILMILQLVQSIGVAEEVRVQGKAPQFTTRLEAREVLAYQEVVLECHVVGIPEPEITWYQVTTYFADLFRAFILLTGLNLSNLF